MRVLLTALLVLALASPAMAAFTGPGSGPGPQGSGPQGGFHGPRSAGITRAADVARAHDDAHVTLIGHIVEQVAHEKYLFRDGSGTVIVDIDDKDFRGQTVTPKTRVRVVGEVDYDHGNKEVDVKFLEIQR